MCTIPFYLQLRINAALIARAIRYHAVAPIVSVANVNVAGGFGVRNASVNEVINKDAGASAKQGSAMWLASASDSVEVVLPGKRRLTAKVVAYFARERSAL